MSMGPQRVLFIWINILIHLCFLSIITAQNLPHPTRIGGVTPGDVFYQCQLPNNISIMFSPIGQLPSPIRWPMVYPEGRFNVPSCRGTYSLEKSTVSFDVDTCFPLARTPEARHIVRFEPSKSFATGHGERYEFSCDTQRDFNATAQNVLVELQPPIMSLDITPRPTSLRVKDASGKVLTEWDLGTMVKVEILVDSVYKDGYVQYCEGSDPYNRARPSEPVFQNCSGTEGIFPQPWSVTTTGKETILTTWMKAFTLLGADSVELNCATHLCMEKPCRIVNPCDLKSKRVRRRAISSTDHCLLNDVDKVNNNGDPREVDIIVASGPLYGNGF